MTTKHVKAKPTTRYKLQNDYQKDRQRRKKLQLLIGTTLFLLVYGVFLKGAAAVDGSTKGDVDPTSIRGNGDPTADEDVSGAVEATIDNVSSAGGGAGSRNAVQSEINRSSYRPDRIGYGTEHEQAGVEHFRAVTYTTYESKVNYSIPKPKSRYGMDPIFKISNSILNTMVTDDTFPEGYVEIRDDKNFYMGRRVQNNDWMPLLTTYWMVWLVVALLLLLIVVMPFIAVCYCCFCCHKRCGRQCPPCDEKPDARRRCCYGFLLLLLIIGLLFGIIIAFATNRLLETGFAESTRNIGRSSDDTCTFLTNTNNHLKHLYINNYQELESQLTEVLQNAHDHIVSDLSDVSKAKALEDLVRILENMPKALKLMREVDTLEKQARFYAAQLRDALRGIKRDLNYIRGTMCHDPLCENFHKTHNIQFMDIGCTDYDKVPNTTIYVEAIEEIMKANLVEIPLNGMEKLKEIGDTIKQLMDSVVPPFIKDIREGSVVMSDQAGTISTLVDKVISDIQLKTMRTTHSIDDIYAKLGEYRNLTNIILCLVLLSILVCLIIALCCGCCGKRRRGYREDCCNKGTGASCLLIAMLLIFLTFSIIALIGLFYFVFGLLAYHGACAPLRDTTRNNIFNSFDSLIDFHKLSPAAKTGYAGEDNTEKPMPPIRLSNALSACHANESIIDVLQLNQLHSVRNIKMLKVLQKIADNAAEIPKLPNSLGDIQLIIDKDIGKLNRMRNGNLSTYHSKVFKDQLCKKFTQQSLTSLASAIDDLAYQLKFDVAWISYKNSVLHLRAYDSDLYKPLKRTVEDLYEKVEQIDKLILYKNLNFNESIVAIMKAVYDAEDFIRKRGASFINDVTANLTSYVVREVENYKNVVIRETEYNVGRCKPLASIYENGVDIVCNRMVDPMNGFWVGVLLCCLIFLPTLWIAHKLQNLYKKVGPYATPVATGGEYLYDAYSERDQYPMANGPKKRRKGHHDRRREYEYYDETSPGMSTHTAADGMRDSRYKDMAPQHWDSEPPRYHHPPMAPPASEYERPPPYYYPGAAEQD